MREVAAEFERPVLLFSGGKDSIVMLRLAEKAFWPARLPFPVMHVDTGHNFPEAIEFRDRRVAELGVALVVASVPDVDRDGPGRRGPARARRATACRRRCCSTRSTEHRFDAVFGGARRDEEKARAKERVFSLPRRVRPVGPEEPAAGAVEPLQRPPPRGRAHPRVSRCRTGPSSTSGSTSPSEDDRAPVDLLRAPARGVPPRRHADGGRPVPRASPTTRSSFETLGALPHGRRHDLHRGGRVERRRPTEQIIVEVAASRITERGATRADDRFSEAAMEDRKREGYF